MSWRTIAFVPAPAGWRVIYFDKDTHSDSTKTPIATRDRVIP